MAADTTSTHRLSADAEKHEPAVSMEKPMQDDAHAENAVTGSSYVPQSDEEYNVTFKTWIVVWVSGRILSLLDTGRLTQGNRSWPGLMASHSGSYRLTVASRP